MELRQYLNILWRERATILLCMATTLIAAYLFTLNQPEVYEATASFVMRPRAALIEDQDDLVRALDTLGRQVSIGSTYVQVASSRLIKLRASESLALTQDVRRGLRVDGQLVAGTNLLEISVQGGNEVVVAEFANQVGGETVKYVSSLYDVFELEPLDTATTPQNPIQPNMLLNLLLGAVLGAGLGVGIGLFTEYWRTSKVGGLEHFDIIDQETGAYNMAYFQQRLCQEVSRVRRRGETFSLVLIRISKLRAPMESVTLRRAATFLHTELRDEDLLAYTGGSIFAILLPDMTGESAKEVVEWLCTYLQSDALTQSKGAQALRCSAGISCFHENMSGADELWRQSVLALTDVNQSFNGKVRLYSQLDGLMAQSHVAS